MVDWSRCSQADFICLHKYHMHHDAIGNGCSCFFTTAVITSRGQDLFKNKTKMSSKVVPPRRLQGDWIFQEFSLPGVSVLFGFCFQYGFYCKQYIYPRIVRPQIPSLLIFYFRCTCDGVFNPCTAAKNNPSLRIPKYFCPPKKWLQLLRVYKVLGGGNKKKTQLWPIFGKFLKTHLAKGMRLCSGGVVSRGTWYQII